MNESSINTRNEDIDSKIADFMADIDEIVLGRKSTSQSQLTTSEWIQCFDETSQSVYYWNTKTNECSWDPPKVNTQIQNVDTSIGSNHSEESNVKRRCLANHQHQSPKKVKKTSLIAEYTSSESETTEEEQTVDDIDELLEEVLEKGDKAETKPLQIDRCPLFETDCRAAIARLLDLEMRNKEVSTLRIQLETRLEDVLAGHLSKPYATRKLEETVVKIDELEKLHLTSMSSSVASETAKPSLTSSEMALLLSLPPPPPPPSPPPPSVSYVTDDPTLQLFYAQLNSNPTESVTSTKSELHQHHHSHKEKKSKPSKTLPTGLIQKWTHALQELRGSGEMNEP